VNRSLLRTLASPVVAAVLSLGVAGAVSLSVSRAVPNASAYVMSNGCDEYDPARGIYYQCNWRLTAFLTPEGDDPLATRIGTGYAGESSGTEPATDDSSGDVLISPGGTYIPPPAPFNAYKDYCSNPWYGNSTYEGKWQRACYNHDVCYGSQLGRKYCDDRFWDDMVKACKSYGWYNPDRYACFVDARTWYYAVRWFGDSHYKPRTSSNEP
jgi:hypothetical protein